MHATPSKQKTSAARSSRESSVSSQASMDRLHLRQTLPNLGGSPRKSISHMENGNPSAQSYARRPASITSQPTAKSAIRPLESDGAGNAGDISPVTSVRSVKAKSLQPPFQAKETKESPHIDEQQRALSAANRSTPGLSSGSPSLHTPKIPHAKSSRRISAFGHTHATGLGARTVSPTDARRMKRLSVMPPPPIPLARGSQPPSPSDVSPSNVENSNLISLTPDTKRKSASSTISLSSTSSSNRASTNILQPRASQTFLASRLPTPKTKASETSEEDDIPPVPPIPKGLATESEPPLYNPRKSSLPGHPGAPTAKVLRQSIAGVGIAESSLKIDSETRRKRGLTMGPTLDTKPSSAFKQRGLQPLRLPPLTLLPLSTPTVNRVNALGTQSIGVEDATPTKSPQRTPSTPLTASKATFSESRRNGVTQQHLTARSTSSTQIMHSPSTSSMRASSSNSSSIPINNSSARYGRSTISPFVSSSAPKIASGVVDTAAPAPNMKVPRKPTLNLISSSSRRKSKDELGSTRGHDTSPSKTPETPSSGSSIRRKLSMSWKRSSSKSSHARDDRDGDMLIKHDNMPPPRLPNVGLLVGSSPGGDGSLPPEARVAARQRNTVYGLPINGHDRTKSESWGSSNFNSLSKDTSTNDPWQNSDALLTTSKKAPSLLAPLVANQRPLSSKSSVSSIRSARLDSTLDTEDVLADDEMRKLATKRKGLEAAAAEVEALQARAGPKDRISAHQALKTTNLNIFERGEVVDYKDVYFTGAPDAKKIVGDLNGGPNTCNFGYDDERGDYNIVIGDHLVYRYEVIDILGKGSFGQVVRCIDHRTGGLVAIKIIRNKKRFHQQALVEVNILQKLREWDPGDKHSLVKFTQSFYFRGHLCISTELLGMNLYEFIKSNDFRGFSLRLIRRFTKQLLSSLVLLKSHRVIHCDLKPENVLLAHPAQSDIKVIDFGSSCLEHEKVYTYIQSRFYRSPEVILGMTYGLPIDMWSLGCILAELYTGYPIFPGENEQEQLACIMEVFGPPEKHLIEKSSRKKLFFDSFGKPRMIVSSKGRRRRPSSKTLQQAIKCDDEAFLDFLAKCLRWDPDKRLKPEEAILHEFITGRKLQKPRISASMESPSKRLAQYNPRPLPEPPLQKLAPGNTVHNMGTPNVGAQSATKSVTKRHSVVGSSVNTNASTKRASNGGHTSTSTSIPTLPRISGRTASISVLKTDSSDSSGTLPTRLIKS
ncbi:hypothetical protein ABW19_dt0208795 [Dactylella cylindrospora]|nr:hypothetical protein ABW19_dt0208795 [Dactylella cylindrospora]